MLTHTETHDSVYETRKIALEGALRIGCGIVKIDGSSSVDGSIIVKNAELFFNFLIKDDING